MIIKELVIYGYGKFQNKHIPFHNDNNNLHVIYGENEAGKSTTMSFIQSIFFGFATKQQTENRYEPRNSGKYGGRIHIETNKYGELIIERTSGKAIGEVFVYFEDGKVRGEDFLKELLGDFDKTTYQAIFSFNIHGLQHIKRLNIDEIGKFLFLSSLYGSDALFYLDNRLTKQQEQIFKRTGRKPALNDALFDLQKKNAQLTDAKRKVIDYESLINERRELEKKLEIAMNEKQELNKELKLKERIHSLMPSIREKKWCDDQLSILKDTSYFPPDGLSLLDQLQQKRTQIEEQVYSYELKIEQIKKEIKHIDVKDNVLASSELLRELKENLSLYEEKKSTYNECLVKIENIEEEIALYKLRLHHSLTDDELLQMKAAIPMKEALKKDVFEYQNLLEKKDTLDEQFEAAKNELEQSEEKISELNNRLLKAEERAAAEVELEAMNESRKINISEVKKEYEQAENDLNMYEKLKRNKKRSQNIFLLVLFAAALVWTVVNEYWIIISLLLGGALLLFYFINKNNDPFIKRLTERRDEMKQYLQSKHDNEGMLQNRYSELQSLVVMDDHLKQMIQQEEIQKQHFERLYERIITKYEQWEIQFFSNQEKIKLIAKNLNLNDDCLPEMVLESFEHLQIVQEKIIKKDQLRKEAEFIASELEIYGDKCNQLAENCHIEGRGIGEIIYIAGKMMEEERELHEKRKKLEERQKELEDDCLELNNKRNYFILEEERLVERAKCNDSDEFKKLGKIAEHREQLLKQKSWIEKQLLMENYIDINNFVLNEEAFTLEKIEEIKQKLETSVLEEKNILKQLSKLIVQIEEIERSGTYSELRYAIEQDRTIVKDLAKQWAVLTLAKDLLAITVESHRKNKLPKLLKQAENYFSFLTHSSYKKIFLPEEEETFIVERSDGMRFHADELSQATVEQLYVALRLALAKSIKNETILPIIIDDSFVNFDHMRTQRVIDLLHEFASEYQIIFFTCHKHLLPRFRTKTIEI
ncbi:AAA family ATPase [Metabacillus fastidiosus]|uniref:ATP-binding protein n=1 Tax=Metabacillus fastidiosus TaxID=1458 RepID=UPI003D27E71A